MRPYDLLPEVLKNAQRPLSNQQLPHQSGKSQLAKELELQQSSYLQNRSLQQALEEEARQHMIQAIGKVPRPTKPLQFSELLDLMSKLLHHGVLLRHQIKWLMRDAGQSDPMIQYGKVTLKLSSEGLHDLAPDLLQWLLNSSLSWTRELGGDVIMEFAVEMVADLSKFPPTDDDIEREISRPPLGDAKSTRQESILIEPGPDDPPGVRSGLVKRYL